MMLKKLLCAAVMLISAGVQAEESVDFLKKVFHPNYQRCLADELVGGNSADNGRAFGGNLNKMVPWVVEFCKADVCNVIWGEIKAYRSGWFKTESGLKPTEFFVPDFCVAKLQSESEVPNNYAVRDVAKLQAEGVVKLIGQPTNADDLNFLRSKPQLREYFREKAEPASR